jgi:hypothetical protein
MDVEAFIHRYPRVFHMAEEGSWPSIMSKGLLSTTALLDRFGYTEPGERRAIESSRRPESVAITDRATGETAVIRDNKPLRDAALAVCLRGMTTTQWYETLNARTFFWVSEERLTRLLNAKAYRARAHDVLTIDTRRLVEAKLPEISVAPINTGFAMIPSTSAIRGGDTFMTIEAYPFEEMRTRRGNENAVVELAVLYAVEGIEKITVRVERRGGGGSTQTIWTPS